MKARIYKPAHTAMQSGKASHRRRWTLRFLESSSPFIDPLMGWTGQTDTTQQLELSFDSEAEALDYAKRKGIEIEVNEPHSRIVKPKSYATNFAFNRVE